MAEQERPPFLILSAAVQTYAWGKRGYNSEAGRLKSCGDEHFTIDEEQTYAEVRHVLVFPRSPDNHSMSCTIFHIHSNTCIHVSG